MELSRTLSRIEASTENTIIARQPIPPPSGRTLTERRAIDSSSFAWPSPVGRRCLAGYPSDASAKPRMRWRAYGSTVRLPLPGPLDLAHAVRDMAAAATSLGRAATGAIALVPRLEDAALRVEGLLARADAAVTALEQLTGDTDAMVMAAGPLLSDAAALVHRIEPVVTLAEGTVARVGPVVEEADRSVQRVQGVLGSAEGAVSDTAALLQKVGRTADRTTEVLVGAGSLVDDADHLLCVVKGPIEQMMPVLNRLAETLEPHEVDAAVLLIDRLPDVLVLVEDVLPVMRQLGNVGPELHDLLELVEDLHRVATGLPGRKLLRRRRDNEPET